MDDIDDDLPWPDVPRAAFAHHGPIDLSACVRWVVGGPYEHAMQGYVEGYRKAAIGLLEWVRASRESPDYHVFPICFLWRHHLELAIKRIIAVGQQLADVPIKVPAKHGLLALWDIALPYVRDIGDDANLFKNVRAGLAEIEAVDPTAAGFRYPLETDLSTPALKSPPTTVNLEAIDVAMRAISTFLDGVHSEQSARLEFIADRMRDCYDACR